MTQEFHISVTPIGGDQYLVRTERVAPGVPLAEEQVTWAVEEWLTQASTLMNDPLTGFLRGDNLDAIANFGGVSPVDQSATTQTLPTNLVSVGQQLYDALFQGTIRDSWMTARGISQHLRQVLRLRLGLKDGRLPRLPWEVMYAGDRPLATGTDILFSRYHSSFAALTSLSQFQQIPAINPQQPLRILMVLAAPTDQEVLALRQEAHHLQEELQQAFYLGNRAGGIELTILDQPGREQLTQALEHNYYQIFHYAGHSNLGTAGGNLYLVNNKTGLSEMLSGDDLAGLLVNNGIRMAVFNSCRGVYTAAAGNGTEGNLAEALVRRGVPAVLAMAERIPDDVALNLSRLFYRNLKQGYPIDLSLNRARQGLISSYGSHQLYWALPILYLHPQFDGYLQVLNNNGDRPALLLDLAAADLAEPLIATNNLAATTPDASDGHLPNELEAKAAIQPTATGRSTTTESDADDFEFDERLTTNLAALTADDLEFDDDFDNRGDWETVAFMVNQLSGTEPIESDRLASVDPTENLLPDAGSINPSYPLPATDRATIEAAEQIGSPSMTLPALTIDSSDPELYQELERLLVDAGKSTLEITACLRAIQQQPNSAEAYHQLGNALTEQGYLTEAIAVYQQAIRLHPTADIYHHLGDTLLQQGNLAEAIQAFNRAIQLDPNLSEPYEKLGHALRRQNQLTAATAAYPTELDRDRPVLSQVSPWQLPPAETAALPADHLPGGYLPRYGSTYLARRQSPLLWAGAGAASVALVLFGGWFAQQQLGTKPLMPGFELPQKTNAERLAQLSTAEVTAIAIERLSQSDVSGGQQAVEALLDRRALSAAKTAMDNVQKQQIEDPIVLSLKGRLAWQASTQTNNRDYSLEDARRFWETAAKQRPSPLTQNALGFVYYTDGKLDLAGKSWFRTIELLGLETDTKTKILPKEAITAYAGMALNLMKTAETLPAERRAGMYAEAIRLRQKVLTAAPADFTPTALAKDWLWSETAIADWRTLLAL